MGLKDSGHPHTHITLAAEQRHYVQSLVSHLRYIAKCVGLKLKCEDDLRNVSSSFSSRIQLLFA